jgi:hypothetical protein
MAANPWNPGHHRNLVTLSWINTPPPPTRTLRAVNAQEDALFTSEPRLTVYAQTVRRLLMQKVRATELVDMVLREMGEVEWVEVPGTRRPRRLNVQCNNIASIPPADGTCHFDRLPAELLKAVFSASLPPRLQTIEPSCGGAGPESLEKRELRPNRVADLMVLSKKLCSHVAEMVYEERTFSIHVHQGQRNAGIEFLHVGRQPLQYQADVKDGRFSKFSPGELFGFSRIKKLEINIYPGDGKCRHTAINTYYMLLALVNLLSDRDDDPGKRITSLDIRFVATYARSHNILQGRTAIPAAESPWWDPYNNQPRETSFHGISDIQLMLQPFARLFGVHNVDITAPVTVAQHQPTIEFVSALRRCMQGKSQSVTFNHTSLNAQLEGMRAVHEDYMLKVLYGGAMVEDDKLEDVRDDDNDDDNDNEDDDDDDDDGDGPHDGRQDTPHDGGEDYGPEDDEEDDSDDDGDDGPDTGMLGGVKIEHKKHGRSPSGQEDAGGGRKRVHFSDDISSSDDQRDARSLMDLDDPSASRDSVFGSRFLAADLEIDSIQRFAMIAETSEEDARLFLGRSNWNLEDAVWDYMDSLAENSEDEDAMRLGISMSLEELELMTSEDQPATVRRSRDMRTGRELDNGMSPTRSGRGDGYIALAQDQPTYSSAPAGPSAQEIQRRRLFKSLLTQDEEAEDAKVNGKGKGKWNNPSNFSQQEDKYEPYNGYDTMMADADWEPYPATEPAASTAVGTSQDHSLAERNTQDERLNTQFRMLAAAFPGADARVSDPDQDVASSLYDLQSSRYFSVDTPQLQSYPGGPGMVNVPEYPQPQIYSGAPGPVYGPAEAASSTPRPSMPPMARPRREFDRVRPPTEQPMVDSFERFKALKAATRERLRLGGPQFARPDLAQSLEDLFDSRAADLAASSQRVTDYLDSSRPAPPPAPTIQANTADDYPEWAGTSYWSAPVEPASAPEPAPAPEPAFEVPAPSSPATNRAPTLDFAPMTVPRKTARQRDTARQRNTIRQALDSMINPSGSRVLRPVFPTQDGGHAAFVATATPAATPAAGHATATPATVMPISAVHATTTASTAASTSSAPATTEPSLSNQIRARRDMLRAMLAAENDSSSDSDSEGEL